MGRFTNCLSPSQWGVVFPAPSGLNGQTKRSERRPAGRARRAPAPGAGPQWAPRVPWGAQPEKKARHADGGRAGQLLRSLLVRLIELLHSSQLATPPPVARRPPRDCRGDLRPVLWPYTTKWTTEICPRSLCSRSHGLPRRPSTTTQMPLSPPSRPEETPVGHLTRARNRAQLQCPG